MLFLFYEDCVRVLSLLLIILADYRIFISFVENGKYDSFLALCQIAVLIFRLHCGAVMPSSKLRLSRRRRRCRRHRRFIFFFFFNFCRFTFTRERWNYNHHKTTIATSRGLILKKKKKWSPNIPGDIKSTIYPLFNQSFF